MWRVGASIALPIVWLSATLLFYAFFATGLSILQDVVVGVVAVLTLLAAMILVWISFGFRLARHWVDG